MHDWTKLIDLVGDAIAGPKVPASLVEGLAESLGLPPSQVDELADEIRELFSEEPELGAMARAGSVDQVVESLSALLVQLKR